MAIKKRTKNSYIVTVTTDGPAKSEEIRNSIRAHIQFADDMAVKKVTVIPVGEK